MDKMGLLSDLSLDELRSLVGGNEQYRAAQLFKWISLGVQYSQMSNIPLILRDELSSRFADTALNVIQQIGASDKSVKMLYELRDGNIIEGIYMPHNYADTLCVSTQVGCRMGCKFCASTVGGLVRNLSAGEIYSQVITTNSLFKTKEKNSRGVDNIVLMGSGEPLDNYENVTKFLRLINEQNGLNISQRNISLSTCGLVEKMYALADEGFSVNLSLSLHATDDEARKAIMPMAKKYTIKEIVNACHYYFNKTGRRIIIEYTMIKGVNMFDIDVRRLKEFVKNIAAHVNLIMLNHVEESALKPCTPKEANDFLSKLKREGVSVTIRRSAGTKIYGGCGQLRRKFVGDKEV